MDNNNKRSVFLKENSIIVGLYGVVGVLVVTAGVLTVKSLDESPIDQLGGEPVNSSITDSYNTEEIGESLYTNIPNIVSENLETNDNSVITVEEENEPIVSIDEPIINDVVTIESESDIALVDEPAVNTSSDELTFTPVEDVATVAMYTAFNEGDKMEWPVTGDVVLPYSALLAIYDPTLDQFRTNESISIASTLGTNVKASAEGQVVEVSSNEVNGNYVTIQHGNGWSTSYGQLTDELNVKVGDVVDAGFILGQIKEPTKYSVELGEHVDFKVTLDDETINPTSVLNNN